MKRPIKKGTKNQFDEEELRALAERLVASAEQVETTITRLAEDGFAVHLLYQDAILALAANARETRLQQNYWSELLKERLGCLGKHFSIVRGDYPDVCLYQSHLIRQLRAKVSSPDDSNEVSPLLERFSDGRGAIGGFDSLQSLLLQRKQREAASFGIAPSLPFDFAFETNRQRYEALRELYVLWADAYDFTFDKRRSKADYLIFGLPLSNCGWELCWADESYSGGPMLNGSIVLTKQGWPFDTRRPDPAVAARIRFGDLSPGLWRYQTDTDRADFAVLGMRCLFLTLSKLSAVWSQSLAA